MSITSDQTFLKGSGTLASSNCIGTIGYPTYCPSLSQSAGYWPGNTTLTVEAVANGFIVSGSFKGKGQIRRVAVDAVGLAALVVEWGAQGPTT